MKKILLALTTALCMFPVALMGQCGTPALTANDGTNIYQTAAIGSHCWTTTNFRATTYADGTEIPNTMIYSSFMYPDENVNLENYGRLYTWYAAMKVPEGTTTSVTPGAHGFVQGICPDGWHLPTEAEVSQLSNYEVLSLHSENPIHWLVPGTNTTGQNMLPGGYYSSALKRFENLRGESYIWTSSSLSPLNPEVIWSSCYCSCVIKTTLPTNAMSVRCVYDVYLPQVLTESNTFEQIGDGYVFYCNGNVTFGGYAASFDRGFQYGTDPANLTNDWHESVAEEGRYHMELADLEPGTTYYYRAYVTNEFGTTYGVLKSFTVPTELIPVVTDSAGTIRKMSATLYGTLYDLGENASVKVGFTYGTSEDALNTTVNKSDVMMESGSFSCDISGLTAATKYYYRAFETNDVDTLWGEVKDFTTCTPMTVATDSASNVKVTTATLYGTVNSTDEYPSVNVGFKYGMSEDALTTEVDGSAMTTAGAYSIDLTGLNASTTYYYKAFETNDIDTVWGEVKDFTTYAPMSVTTDSANNVLVTTATLHATVNELSYNSSVNVGFMYGTSEDALTTEVDGSAMTAAGVYSIDLTGLNASTTYYYKAFETNDIDTVWGEVKDFTTYAPMSVTTDSANNVLITTATLHGTVNELSASTSVNVGFMYGTSEDALTTEVDGSAMTAAGAYSIDLTGLNAATTYYYKAFETNDIDTVWGEVKNFTTYAPMAVTTDSANNVLITTATLHGTVNGLSNNSSVNVGFMYGTSEDALTTEVDGSAMTTAGAYSIDLTGLTASTKYYYKAFETNDIDTVWGEVKDFTTYAPLSVTTDSANNVLITSATLHGTVNGLSNNSSVNVGFMYGTSEDALTTEVDGSAMTTAGAYSIDLTGLTAATTYYYKAFETNDIDTVWGEVKNFTTYAPMSVTTDSANNVLITTATLHGTVNELSASTSVNVGFMYGTSEDALTTEVDGSAMTTAGAYSIDLTGLTASTTYYYKAFETNDIDTVWGEVKDFTTYAPLSVTTDSANNVLITSATLHGTVNGLSNNSSVNVGFMYGMSEDALTTEVDGSAMTTAGAYSIDLTGLTASTKYYYKAFETNDIDTVWGEVKDFTTYAPMTVTTDSANNVLVTTATLHGTVNELSYSSSVNVGFKYGMSEDALTTEVDGSAMTTAGAYSIDLTGLTASTTYYYKAFETNDIDTVWGEVKDFTTYAPLSVTTDSANNVLITSATLHGTVNGLSNNSSVNVGFMYGTSEDALTTEVDGSAMTTSGAYSIDLTGLTASTTYYYKAFETNGIDTVWGEVKDFTTYALMSVATDSAHNVRTTTATLYGTVNELSYNSSVNVGFMYGTSEDALTTEVDGSAMTTAGAYSIDLTGLTASTTYYYKAFETNDIDTVWGEVKNFTTYAPMAVTTDSANNVLVTTATLHGTVNELSYNSSVNVGFMYGTSEDALTTEVDGSAMTAAGAYSIDLSELSAATKYYYKAFETNGIDTVWGEVKDFTTYAPMSVTTDSANNVLVTTATLHGTVNELSYNSSVNVGFMYGTSEDALTTEVDGNAMTTAGAYSIDLTGLTASTTYYYKAFETNDIDTVWGEVKDFTTYAPLSVTTDSANNITYRYATLHGTVNELSYNTSVNAGFQYGMSEDSLIHTVMAGTDITTAGVYSCTLLGLTATTTYYYRAFETNAIDTVWGEVKNFTTDIYRPFTCGIDSVSDHQGNMYATVKMGTQCWTRENMRCTTAPDGTVTLVNGYSGSSYSTPYYYEPTGSMTVNGTTYTKEDFVKKYGLLYNYPAVMAIDNDTTEFDYPHRGICPEGWHVPTKDEWHTMGTFVYNNYQCPGCSGSIVESTYYCIAKALAATTDWEEYSGNCYVGNDLSANNATGFSALPAGYYSYYYNDFSSLGYVTYFWSATPYDEEGASEWHLWNDENYLYSGDRSRYYGQAVRCIQNPMVVTTDSVSDVTENSAILHGTLTDMGDNNLVTVGFKYGTSESALESDATVGTMTETGSFSHELTGLDASTVYYRAFATNNEDTVWGEVMYFTPVSEMSVTTDSATNVGGYVAILHGTINGMSNPDATTAGFVYGTNENALTDTISKSVSVTGDYSISVSNLSNFTQYYYKAFETDGTNTAWGEVKSFTTTSFTCGIDSVADHEDNRYATVKMGTQCWTRDNMRCTTAPDGTVTLANGVGSSTSTSTPYYYEPTGSMTVNDTTYTKEDYVKKFGLMYNYPAVMAINGQDTAFDYPHRGICPEGWHVPTRDEWQTMATFVLRSDNPDYKCSGCDARISDGSYYCIAKALAATTDWEYNSDSEDCAVGNGLSANNATGFSLLPTGYYGSNYSSGYNSLGSCTYLWCATPYDEDEAYQWYIGDYDDYIAYYACYRSEGDAVRCLRNSMVVTTDSADNVSANTSILYGTIADMGSVSTSVTAGFKYGTSRESLTSTITSAEIITDITTFNCTLTDLTGSTTYYQAFAVAEDDTVWGEIKYFTPISSMSVTTDTADQITRYSAKLRGTVNGFNGGNSVTAGFVYGTSQNTFTDTVFTSVSVTGPYNCYIQNLTDSTKYYYKAFETDGIDTVWGEVKTFTSLAFHPFFCGTDKINDHEGNQYATVKIGSQCWTKENMRCTTAPEGALQMQNGGFDESEMPRYYIPDENETGYSPEEYVEKFGVLYNFPAAMAIDTNDMEVGYPHQGICPAGWHLPTYEETYQMAEYVYNTTTHSYECDCFGYDNDNEYEFVCIGKELADSLYWSYFSDPCAIGNNPAANNITGFSARPAGYYADMIYGLGQVGLFWVASEYDFAVGMFGLGLDADDNTLIIQRSGPPSFFGASVRCLRDSVKLGVTTDSVSNVNSNTATLNGTITEIIDESVVIAGFQYGHSDNDMENVLVYGQMTSHGSFSSDIDLVAASTVYYRAFATNSEDTVWGEIKYFTPISEMSVTTNSATNVGNRSATLHGTINGMSNPDATTAGFVYGTDENALTDTISKSVSVTGDYNIDVNNLISLTQYYYKAFETDGTNTEWGEVKSFTTTTFTCGIDSVADHQNNMYATVKIGSQCWTKENMRCTTAPDGTVTLYNGGTSTSYSTPYYYEPTGSMTVNDTTYTKEDYVKKFGLLYNYPAVMAINGQDTAFGYPHRGICPEGWHVPTKDEWQTMATFVLESNNPDYKCSNCDSYIGDEEDGGGYYYCIAKALAATTDWEYDSEDCAVGNGLSANNATGFSLLPTGYYGSNYSSGYNSLGSCTYLWCATPYDEDDVYEWYLGNSNDYLYFDNSSRYFGQAVRCLRNSMVVTTDSADNVSANTSILYGTIADMGSVSTSVTAGFKYGTSRESLTSTITSAEIITDITTFNCTLTDLTGSTTYYQAFAVAEDDTVWGEIKYFTPMAEMSVTTDSATNVGYRYATLHGTINGMSNPDATIAGFVYGTAENALTDTISKSVSVTGSYSVNVGNLSSLTQYYYKAFETDGTNTVWGDVMSFTTTLFTCGISSINDHEGNQYSTVKIGSQCWTSENMRCTTSPEGALEMQNGGFDESEMPRYYIPKKEETGLSPEDYVEKFGVLYNFPAAMAIDTNDMEVGYPHQGICPAGWHLPTYEETYQMAEYVYNNTTYSDECDYFEYDDDDVYVCVGKELADSLYWSYSSEPCAVGNNPAANNTTGFSARPAGYFTDEFYGFGQSAYFWNASEYDYAVGIFGMLRGDNVLYLSRKGTPYYFGVSVRCIQNMLSVTTDSVSDVTENSAILHGTLTEMGENISVTVGFKYGTSESALESVTTVGTMTQMRSFSHELTGLAASTVYFRAFATNNEDTVWGEIKYFTPMAEMSVTTDIATNVGYRYATLHGTINGMSNPDATIAGFVYGTAENALTDTISKSVSVTGSYSVNVGNLSSLTQYYYKAFETDGTNTVWGEVKSFTTINFTCGIDSVADHEGNSYATVKIGSQCWTSENMRCTTAPDGNNVELENGGNSTSSYSTPYYYMPTEDMTVNGTTYTKEAYVKKYGLLYNYPAAMAINGQDTAFDYPHRGICPQGWHVPTKDEWQTMATFVLESNDPDYKCPECDYYIEEYVGEGYYYCISKALAATTDWCYDSDDCVVGNGLSANNATGFSLLPAGYYGGVHNSLGYNTYLWCATPYDEKYAYQWHIGNDDEYIAYYSYDRTEGDAVRCVRNPMTVITDSVSNVTENSAILHGTLSAIGDNNSVTVGFKYGTSESAMESVVSVRTMTDAGLFSQELMNLTPSTIYYRAFVTNNTDTVWGEIKYFTPIADMSVTTDSATNVGGYFAILHGTINGLSNPDATIAGFVYGTDENDLSSSVETSVSVTGNYSINIDGLTPLTTYFYRAFESDGEETVLGEVLSFTTAEPMAVTTDSVQVVGEDTIKLCATVNNLGGYAAVAAGFKYGTSQDELNTTVTVDAAMTTTGAYSCVPARLTSNTIYYYQAFAAYGTDTIWGAVKTFISTTNFFNCGRSTIQDVDGNIYNTVLIGSQCWLKENLKTTNGLTRGTDYYYPNNNAANVNNYGLLYTWNVANKNASSSSSDVQGICPEGWRMPSEQDVHTLTRYVFEHHKCPNCGTSQWEEKTDCIANALASQTGWNYKSNDCAIGKNLSQNNATGFSAMPAGIYSGSNGYENFSHSAYFWTTAYNGSDGSFFRMHADRHDVWIESGKKSRGCSVRCLAGDGVSFDDDISVITDIATDILDRSAILHGNVNGIGENSSVTAGFKYGTAQNALNATVTKSEPLTTIESYSCNVRGLNSSTTYYYKAFAVSGNDTVWGNVKSFITSEPLPVYTDSATNVIYRAATLHGTVNELGGGTAATVGFKYGINQNELAATVSTTVTATGDFSCNITGLDASTVYYYKAFEATENDTIWGAVENFTTSLPMNVVTDSADNVTYHSATLHGTVNVLGGLTSVTAGFKYGIEQNTLTNIVTKPEAVVAESFSLDIDGLNSGTTCYYQAFETDGVDTVVGAVMSFTTSAPMAVTTDSADNITYRFATLHGTVNELGGLTSVAVGFNYGTAQNALTNTVTKSEAVATGSFVCNIDGLSNETTYYYQAFETDGIDTVVGEVMSFTTSAPMAVTTDSADNITYRSATLHGTVNELGGLTSVAVGFNYGTAQNALTNTVTKSEAVTAGSFVCNIEGLNEETTYYFQSFETNGVDTVWGELKEFATLQFHCEQDNMYDVDGNDYPTVKIGIQCWMKENLRTTHYANGDTVQTFYHVQNSSEYDDPYGLLYNWNTVMNNEASSSSKPSGVQGICPDGWHLPSDSEWTRLTDYVGSQDRYICGGNPKNIAQALTTSTWNSSPRDCGIGKNPHNATGFSVLPAGHYSGDNSSFGGIADFWCATEVSSTIAYRRDFNSYWDEVFRQESNKNEGYSVRCLLNSVVMSVTTDTAIATDYTAATLYGNVTELSQNDSILVGFNYGTDENNLSATILKSGSVSATGTYSCDISGLSDATLYYKAFAISNTDTVWGEIRSYISPKPMNVVTDSATKVTYRAATLHGTANGLGKTNAATAGFKYGVDTTALNTIVVTADVLTAMGAYSLDIDGLRNATTYYYQAFETDGVDTVVGAVMSFTTSAPMAVTTDSADNFTYRSATLRGTVNGLGGFTAVIVGFKYGIEQNTLNTIVTTADALTELGAYSLDIDGLSSATTYYYQAFETDGIDTVVGEVLSFTTSALMAVTTDSADNITYRSATLHGTVNELGGFTSVTVGFKYGTAQNALTDTVTKSETVTAGSFVCNIEGLNEETTYYFQAFETNGVDTVWGGLKEFATVQFHCEQDNMYDVDGNDYPTVKIGIQCWMKENLRTTHYANGDTVQTFYHVQNSSTYDDPYGLLYNWNTVMHNESSSSSKPSGVQGICPDGWHLPSDTEWTQLTDYVGSQDQYICGNNPESIVQALTTSIKWDSRSLDCGIGKNPHNATGFSVLPAGYYNNGYTAFGYNADFWSATEVSSSQAYRRDFNSYWDVVFRQEINKNEGYSVRCLLNTVVMSVTTDTAIVTDYTAATLYGNVTELSQNDSILVGFNYGTDENNLSATILKSGSVSATGTYSCDISGLSDATLYYKAFAISKTDTVWGTTRSYIPPKPMNVVTDSATKVTYRAATLHGTVNSLGKTSAATAGFKYGVDTTALNTIVVTADVLTAMGAYSLDIDGLSNETTYYYQAFETDGVDTVVGAVMSFTTSAPMAVTTDSADNITYRSATLHGTVNELGGLTSVTVGFNYGTAQNALTNTVTKSEAVAAGSFVCNIDGLNDETTYYYQAFENAGNDTVWGEVMNFTTRLPMAVTTDNADNITYRSATLRGTVNELGGFTSVTVGFKYGTAQNDLTNIVTNPEAVSAESFECSIDGLSNETTYYFQAFEISGTDTVWGETMTFVTSEPMSVTTDSVQTTQNAPIILYGNINNMGGCSTMTAGFKYGTSHDDLNMTVAVDTALTIAGKYSCKPTLLMSKTMYYYQAFEANGTDTVYGLVKSFMNPTFHCEIYDVQDVDGNRYHTVQIGSQCWLKENLKTTNGLTSGDDYFYPGADMANVKDYGLLYTWNAANANIRSSSTSSLIQGICPSGWRMPNVQDVNTLTQYVFENYRCENCGTAQWEENTDCIAQALASKYGWNECTNTCTIGENIDQNDATGFSAMPAGHEFSNLSLHRSANFWTSVSSDDNDGGYAFKMIADRSKVSVGWSGESGGYSVRCIYDDGVASLSVVTDMATEIKDHTAILSGIVNGLQDNDVVTAGFKYGPSQDALNATVTKSETITTTGVYSCRAKGMNAVTTYYYKAFAVSGNDTVWGKVKSFMTADLLPVNTDSVSHVKSNMVVLHGTVNALMNESPVTVGFKYGTSENALTASIMKDGEVNTIGAFSCNIDGLHHSTTYFYQAFETSGTDTIWGEVYDFVSIPLTVTTGDVNNITCYTAALSGNILNMGGNDSVTVGFKYGKADNALTVERVASTAGTYSIDIDGLNSETTYYYQAFETDGTDTVWGDVKDFTTDYLLVSTGRASDITATTVTLHGVVNRLGGMNAVAVGFKYGKNINSLDSTVLMSESISSVGEYSYNLDGLSSMTKYYYQAFETVGTDTVWGVVNIFSTPVNCGIDEVKDSEGHTYSVVKIGNQCWMAENMRTTAVANSDAYCHVDDDSANDNIYGLLYTSDAASRICPQGWHVPRKSEWEQMTQYVFGNAQYRCGNCEQWQENTDCIAKALASNTLWKVSTNDCAIGNNLNANGATGFNALPAGYYQYSLFGSNFHEISEGAYFWSNESDYYYQLSYDAGNIVRDENTGLLARKQSVRCVANAGKELSVVTDAPSNVSHSSATLRGYLESLDENAFSVNVGFRYGTDSTAMNNIVQRNEPMSYERSYYSCNTRTLKENTTYYYQAFVTAGVDTVWSNIISHFTTLPFVCGTDKIIDVDANRYSTVQIGNQCWMAENLRTTHYEDGTPIAASQVQSLTVPYYYHANNDQANDSLYGLLYNWKATMGDCASSNNDPSGVQGICPAGWHVPSATEWTRLTNYVKQIDEYLCDNWGNWIGKALAGKIGWSYVSFSCGVGHDLSSNNATGFNALPAGNYFEKGTGIYAFGENADFWSSTAVNSDKAHRFDIVYKQGVIYLNQTVRQDYGYSVRCVCDSAYALVKTVSTDSTSNSTYNSATLHGTVVEIDGHSSFTVGFRYGTSNNNLSHTVIASENISNVTSFSCNISNLQFNTQYYYQAFITAENDTTWGRINDFTNTICGTDNIRDIDNNKYATVKIGDQCWMAENLRTTHYADGTAIDLGTDTAANTAYYYYVNNNSAKTATYGLLYNWKAVMGNAASSNANPSGVQGICPEGWHVPSDAEWTQMTNFVSSQSAYWCSNNSSYIAKALAGTIGWASTPEACGVGNNPTNATGFNALPAGGFSVSGYSSIGVTADFWSATQDNANSAYRRDLNHYWSSVFAGTVDKTFGYSVRCLLN